jgi:hypothetical protein
MVKFIIKLALAALVVNASWQLGSTYMAFYRFRDAVLQVALDGEKLADDQLRQRVAELAAHHDVPLTEADIAIRREERHTYIDGSYTKQVTLLPGYRYPWSFEVKVDGHVIKPVTLGDLQNQ